MLLMGILAPVAIADAPIMPLTNRNSTTTFFNAAGRGDPSFRQQLFCSSATARHRQTGGKSWSQGATTLE